MRPDVLEDLSVDVGRQLVAHDITVARRLDHIRLAQHAEVLTRGGPAATEDTREVARRELVVAESAHDLETSPVAEHLQKALHAALGHRRERLPLCGLDGFGIDGGRASYRFHA